MGKYDELGLPKNDEDNLLVPEQKEGDQVVNYRNLRLVIEEVQNQRCFQFLQEQSFNIVKSLPDLCKGVLDFQLSQDLST